MKLHIHGSAWSAPSHNNSIYVSSSEATKLFSEFHTEGKFSPWLYSRTNGRAVPEKLFAQAVQEQQQAANPFPAWTRAMEAEEQPMSSMQVHSWESPGLSYLLLLLPPLPLYGT